MTDLKPCPCCGSGYIETFVGYAGESCNLTADIDCSACGLSMSVSYPSDWEKEQDAQHGGKGDRWKFKTAQEAMAESCRRWNRRTI